MVPVAVGVALVIAAAVGLISDRLSDEIEQAVTDKIEVTTALVQNELGAIDGLRTEMVQAGLRTLRADAARVGVPRVEGRVPLGSRDVPNLQIGDESQVMTFGLVDKVKDLVGGTATLFVKDGSEYVRVSTNVKKDDGSRAVGTVLNPEGKAYAAISSGVPYYGVVEILGHPYLTGYEPMQDSTGQTVGIWYAGYRLDEMDELYSMIQSTHLLDHGFFALVDNAGKIVAAPEDADPQVLEAAQSGASDEWVVSSAPIAAWGYELVAAYPRADVATRVRPVQVAVIVGGVVALVLLLSLFYVFLRRVVVRPVGELSGAAKRVAEGEYDVAVNVRGGNEIGAFAVAFNQMAQRMEL